MVDASNELNKSGFQTPYKSNTPENTTQSTVTAVKTPVFLSKKVLQTPYRSDPLPNSSLKPDLKDLDSNRTNTEQKVEDEKLSAMFLKNPTLSKTGEKAEVIKTLPEEIMGSNIDVSDQRVPVSDISSKEYSEADGNIPYKAKVTTDFKPPDVAIERNDLNQVNIAMETDDLKQADEARETNNFEQVDVAMETNDLDLDMFSEGNEEEDLYSCSLAEARKCQADIIEKKNNKKIQPVIGRLLSTKKSAAQRLTLKQLIDWSGNVGLIIEIHLRVVIVRC